MAQTTKPPIFDTIDPGLKQKNAGRESFASRGVRARARADVARARGLRVRAARLAARRCPRARWVTYAVSCRVRSFSGRNVTGRPASGGRPADNHDYRECFYASQPDRGRAAQVCDRFPCRVYREGHQHGFADGFPRGYAVGYAKGYDDGYAKGYPDGIAACPRPHGNG